jgi:hypothetical protein
MVNHVPHRVVRYRYSYNSRFDGIGDAERSALLYYDKTTTRYPWWLTDDRVARPVWVPSLPIDRQVAFYLRRPVKIVGVEAFYCDDDAKKGSPSTPISMTPESGIPLETPRVEAKPIATAKPFSAVPPPLTPEKPVAPPLRAVPHLKAPPASKPVPVKATQLSNVAVKPATPAKAEPSSAVQEAGKAKMPFVPAKPSARLKAPVTQLAPAPVVPGSSVAETVKSDLAQGAATEPAERVIPSATTAAPQKEKRSFWISDRLNPFAWKKSEKPKQPVPPQKQKWESAAERRQEVVKEERAAAKPNVVANGPAAPKQPIALSLSQEKKSLAQQTAGTTPSGKLPQQTVPQKPDSSNSRTTSQKAPEVAKRAPAKPVFREPVVKEPVATKPVVKEPVATKPVVKEPVAAKPAPVPAKPKPAVVQPTVKATGSPATVKTPSAPTVLPNSGTIKRITTADSVIVGDDFSSERPTLPAPPAGIPSLIDSGNPFDPPPLTEPKRRR